MFGNKQKKSTKHTRELFQNAFPLFDIYLLNCKIKCKMKRGIGGGKQDRQKSMTTMQAHRA